VLRQNLFFALALMLISLTGRISAQSPVDSVIDEPYSIDSLFITPAMPREGEPVTLHAFTTQTSSPCGLKEYQVIYSTSNSIYVIARYWKGSLTALCQSYDSMQIGSLQAGHYILNFMNLKRLAFTVYPQPGCKADFSYEYLRCSSGERCQNTIRFMDQSKGMIHNWHWNFGDGTASDEQNPVHQFPDTGVFQVTLTISGGLTQECQDQITKSVPLVPSFCKAFFTYKVLPSPWTGLSDSSGFMPYPAYLVKFNDLSVGNVKLWSWDFGDGTASNEQHPVHIYHEGSYIVTLKITTEYGCESSYQQRLVLFEPQACIHTGTVRDYTGLDGCHFIIELDNGPKLEPVHLPYPFEFYDGQRVAVGYQPLLDAASICMVGILADITCIREIQQPECKAHFTYAPDSLADCLCYYFDDQSMGNVISWHWDFGDGTTSEEQNPHHIFASPNDTNFYQVCLTIMTATGCTDTYCEIIYLWTPQPEVPWVPVIGGEDNHTIVVSERLGVATGLESGDYIGLFFRDYHGGLRCGGMIRWEGQNGILTAWENTSGNDTLWITAENDIFPIPFYKNGFFEGEKIEYKIWKWRENKVIDIQHAYYTLSHVFPDSGYYKDDGMSLLTGFSNCHVQEIELHKGWNMVSLNVDPVDPMMRKIFGDMTVIVKNYKGEIVYFPYVGITDGIWNVLEGYKVKSMDDAILKVSGKSVNPQMNIPLPGSSRPYFLPYFYSRPYAIQSMMRYVTENIRYVQTYEYLDGVIRALNYIPRYGIDQIHAMKPGFAYRFSLIMPVRSFTYPVADQDSNWLCCQNLKSTWIEPTFIPEYEIENNRILVITGDVLSIGDGAKVSIVAGDNILVGSETAEGGNLALTMWDLPNDDYTIIQMTVEEDNKVSSYTIDLSQQDIDNDGLIILTEGMISGIDEDEVSLFHKLYPTVADHEVSLEITLEKAADVSLVLYDMLGNRVKQVEFTGVGAGKNHFTVGVGNLINGQYLYSINTGDKLTRGKFQVQH